MQWRTLKPAIGLCCAWLVLSAASALVAGAERGPSPWYDVGATVALVLLVVAFVGADLPALFGQCRPWVVRARHWLLVPALLLPVGAILEGWFWLAGKLALFIDYLEPFREHGWPLVSAFALVSLAPAVIEEIAMRGFVFGRFRSVLGDRDALILQAVLFAILHMNLLVLPSHFLMGLLFGVLRLRSGSLLPGMLAHALWNAWCLQREIWDGGWPA